MIRLTDRHGRELTGRQVIGKVLFRLKKIYVEFVVMLLHWVGHVPLHSVRKLAYRLAGIRLGHGSTIHTLARFHNPDKIIIGEDTIIGEGVVLDGRAPLTIGSHVDIASQVMIYNAYHDLQDPFFAPVLKPVTIEDYVFIGPRAIILPGVTIGKGAAVAAAAVVTKDVPPCAIVAGVPARQVGERSPEALTYKLGRADWFR